MSKRKVKILGPALIEGTVGNAADVDVLVALNFIELDCLACACGAGSKILNELPPEARLTARARPERSLTCRFGAVDAA
jgi:hypothetical protein